MTVLSATLSACGTLGARFGGGGKSASSLAQGPAVEQLDATSARASLRNVVAAHIDDAGSDAAAAKDRLVRKKPYYLKEYADYPADALNIMVIELQETESRTAPFRAEVTLPKTRYATRLHRNRQTAGSDAEFFRQPGRETLNLVLRSGRWHTLGSAFVADRIETSSGGVWQESETESAPGTVADPKRAGWFSRQWSNVFGD